MNSYHLAALLSISLAGCGLDGLENKKSDFQKGVEYRAALTLPSPLPSSPAEPNPVVADVPVVEAPTPTCIETFRINHCNGNEATPW